jgi:hypothetical protein
MSAGLAHEPIRSPIRSRRIGRSILALLAGFIVNVALTLGTDFGLQAAAVLFAIAGAVATWSKDLGPHWYPLVLIVLALPTGWAGARLRIARAH